MTHVRGMVIRLRTENEKYAGTDDHIYIGVVGTAGGREFPLDVRRFNDFERGTDVKYWLGDVWDGSVLSNARNPYEAHDWNDPEKWRIEMDDVNQVYVRKGGTGTGRDDDAYKMDEVEVILYGASPNRRTFSRTTDIWLANEYGLQVWLPESR